MALAEPTPQLANILGARASLLMESNSEVSSQGSNSDTVTTATSTTMTTTTTTSTSTSTTTASDTASIIATTSLVASAKLKLENAMAASNATHTSSVRSLSTNSTTTLVNQPLPSMPSAPPSSAGSGRHRQHKRTESQVMMSARALNELRAKFDTIGETPTRNEVSLMELMSKFQTGQEEVNLWLGATTVALASLEAGGLGSLEDLEGTAALVVSVNRFTLQMESLTSIGKDIRRRLQLESSPDIDARQVEKDCDMLEQSWRELRERVTAARKMAVEIQERDQETENIFRVLDADVTRSLGASNTSAGTLDALERRLIALETRVKEMAPADVRARERLEARVRSVRNTLKGARAAANRRHDTFTAVAGQLDDLLSTLRTVATRCLTSLRDCEEHFKKEPTNAAAGMTAEAKQHVSEFQAKRKHYTPAVEKLLQLLSSSVMATKAANAATASMSSSLGATHLATPDVSEDEAEEVNDREDRAVMRRYTDAEQAWEQVQEIMWDVDTLHQELETMEADAKSKKKIASDSEEDETHLYPELSVLSSLSRGASPSHRSDSSHEEKPVTRGKRPKTPSRLKQPGFMLTNRPATSHDLRAPPNPNLLTVPSPLPCRAPTAAAAAHHQHRQRSYTPDVPSPARRAKSPSVDVTNRRMGAARVASPAPTTTNRTTANGNTRTRTPLRHQPSAHQLRTTTSERPTKPRAVSPLPHSRTTPGRFLNATTSARDARPSSSMARYQSAPSPTPPVHTRRSSHGAAITRASTSMGVRSSGPRSPPLPVPRGATGTRAVASATPARLAAHTATARPASSLGGYGRSTPTPVPASVRRVERESGRSASSMGQYDLTPMPASEGVISRPAPSLLSATARYYAPGKNVSAERAATPLPPPTADVNDDDDDDDGMDQNGKRDVSPPVSIRSQRSRRSSDDNVPSIDVTQSASSKLRVKYVPDRKDPLDIRVAAIVNNAPLSVPIRRVNNGRYSFGGKVWFCKMEPPPPPPKNGYGAGTVASRPRDNVSVRVGGGWKDLEVVLMECAIAD